MKFKHGTRRRAAEYEKDWVQRWKDDDTFNKSVENRPANNSWVFYDGPPFNWYAASWAFVGEHR